MAKAFISAKLGQDTDGRSCAVPPGFDRYGKNGSHKGLRIGWLQLSTTETLKKEMTDVTK